MIGVEKGGRARSRGRGREVTGGEGKNGDGFKSGLVWHLLATTSYVFIRLEILG